MALKHRRLLWRDSLLSTLFVYFCLALFALNPFNIHVFNLLTNSFSDIEITDIIYSGKNAKNSEIQTKISKQIVLINAADRNRKEMAALLNKINLENPAVVGVDFIFEGPKGVEEDSALAAALAGCRKVVVATKFKDDKPGHKNENYSGVWRGLGNHTEGYANLRINSAEKTVRTFRSRDETKGKSRFPFALEVVRSFDSSKADAFLARKQKFELINYEGNLNTFYHFNGNQIAYDQYPKGFLKDKIVLLGYFGSDCNLSPVLDDIFYTPMNEKLVNRKFPDTYGVVIQANIVNMMLEQHYVQQVPLWLDWLIGFLLCFFHNLIFLYLFVHRHF